MFGVEKSKIGIAFLLLMMLIIPVALAEISAQEVYDINDRQTRDLKSYIDNQLTATKDSVSKMTDTLFQTFDKRMQDLTKNFAIQTTIMMFFAVLLANALSILMRQGHEKKLIEFRYNNLLTKEVELNSKIAEFNIKYENFLKAKDKADSRPSPAPQSNTQPEEDTQPKPASRPVGRPKKIVPEIKPEVPLEHSPDPQPIPGIPAKPQKLIKRGPFGLFARLTPEEKAALKLKKDTEKALKEVK
jgi:hypothetical protein